MKPRENQDYWQEVEECLKEGSPSGYKMALIEADKILSFVLKQKGYPGKNVRQQVLLAGWRLEDKKSLEKALEKRDEIINNLEYRLSTFEAEDAVKAYREAILHFSSKKAISFGKRAALYYTHYLSIKSSFFQKSLIILLLFFLFVKFLTATTYGKTLGDAVVGTSNFIFSWFMVFLLLGIAIGVIVIGSFMYFGREKVRIKDND